MKGKEKGREGRTAPPPPCFKGLSTNISPRRKEGGGGKVKTKVKIDKKKGKKFTLIYMYKLVMKQLYISKKVRPDLTTTLKL